MAVFRRLGVSVGPAVDLVELQGQPSKPLFLVVVLVHMAPVARADQEGQEALLQIQTTERPKRLQYLAARAGEVYPLQTRRVWPVPTSLIERSSGTAQHGGTTVAGVGSQDKYHFLQIYFMDSILLGQLTVAHLALGPHGTRSMDVQVYGVAVVGVVLDKRTAALLELAETAVMVK